MSSTAPAILDGRHIVVADEDPNVVAFVVGTLRGEGYAVFHAYDGLAAVQLALALTEVHLLISNTRVHGVDGIVLIHLLREQLPSLPILYLANSGGSTPEMERRLPPDVQILREPFSAEELRAAVDMLLNSNAVESGETP
jgi:two-component system OmpR family response regulator